MTRAIRDVPDFPKAGILFKDITPVLADARLFAEAPLTSSPAASSPAKVDAVVGIDARGFIFAAAAAAKLQCGFVPVRKKGKLPWQTYEESYDLEYGSNTIAIHTDAVKKGARVLLIDDLLATGGTAAAADNLLRRLGANMSWKSRSSSSWASSKAAKNCTASRSARWWCTEPAPFCGL